MNYYTAFRQSINKNSKNLLLLTVCFLTMWGMWTFSDAFGLFRRYQAMPNTFWYSSLFFKQIIALILGIITFIFIRKFDFERKTKYPFIWLIIPAIVVFLTMYDFSSKYLHLYLFNISFRSGMLITLGFVFFFMFNVNNEKKFSTREITGLSIYICLMNMLLSSFDLIMALMFNITCILLLFFSGRKKLAFSLMSINIVISAFLLLFNSYARYRTFTTYFDNKYFYQVSQSLKCLMSGLFWGYGPAGSYISSVRDMNSSTIENHLPIPLPDFGDGFIFSVVGFQYGFPGIMIMLIAFLTIIFLGIKAIKQAGSKSSALLMLTSIMMFTLSIFIGMATPLGLIPPNSEGIFLFSYGGTSRMMFAFFTFALIYRNLTPEGDSPNYLSLNSKYLYAAVLLLFSIIPLRIIYFWIKWNLTNTF